MAFWRSLRINVIELPSNQAATIEPVVSWSNRTQLVSLFPGIDFSKGTLQKMDEFRRPKSTTLLEPGQPWSYVFFQSGWGFPWVQVTFIWPSAFPWPTRGVLKDNFDTPPTNSPTTLRDDFGKRSPKVSSNVWSKTWQNPRIFGYFFLGYWMPSYLWKSTTYCLSLLSVSVVNNQLWWGIPEEEFFFLPKIGGFSSCSACSKIEETIFLPSEMCPLFVAAQCFATLQSIFSGKSQGEHLQDSKALDPSPH